MRETRHAVGILFRKFISAPNSTYFSTPARIYILLKNFSNKPIKIILIWIPIGSCPLSSYLFFTDTCWLDNKSHEICVLIIIIIIHSLLIFLMFLHSDYKISSVFLLVLHLCNPSASLLPYDRSQSQWPILFHIKANFE